VLSIRKSYRNCPAIPKSTLKFHPIVDNLCWPSYTLKSSWLVAKPFDLTSHPLQIAKLSYGVSYCTLSDGVKDTMSEAKNLTFKAKDLVPEAKAKDATFVVKANTEDLILE
jgi:hypothetical protein